MNIDVNIYSDKNECEDGSHNCISKANCGNLNGHEGKFECFCKDGYTGDGLLNGTGCTGNSLKNILKFSVNYDLPVIL